MDEPFGALDAMTCGQMNAELHKRHDELRPGCLCGPRLVFMGTSLAGGHFITSAWALVMLYDYHRGRDFADEGFELRRPIFVEITPELAERYFERFSGGFDTVDFGRYSKVKNPQLTRYNFGFARLLEPKP